MFTLRFLKPWNSYGPGRTVEFHHREIAEELVRTGFATSDDLAPPTSIPPELTAPAPKIPTVAQPKADAKPKQPKAPKRK